MTHAELKELECSDLQAAIDYVRAALVEFVLEVMGDESYSSHLRAKAAAAAAPFVHGPPPGGPVDVAGLLDEVLRLLT